jgi:hypothetical protein
MDGEFALIRMYLLEPLRSDLRADMTSLRLEFSQQRKAFEEFLRDQHTDHEQRLRSIEEGLLPKWVWPALTVAVAAVSALSAHLLVLK